MNYLKQFFHPETPESINARILRNAKSELALAYTEKESIEARITQCLAAINRLEEANK
jgi:hypothetical protein